MSILSLTDIQSQGGSDTIFSTLKNQTRILPLRWLGLGLCLNWIVQWISC